MAAENSKPLVFVVGNVRQVAHASRTALAGARDVLRLEADILPTPRALLAPSFRRFQYSTDYQDSSAFRQAAAVSLRNVRSAIATPR